MCEVVVCTRGWFSEPERKAVLDQGYDMQNMLEVTPFAGRKPMSSIFDWGVYFPHMAQVTRATYYQKPRLSDLVQNDADLTRAIQQAVKQILKQQQKQLKGISGKGDINDNKSNHLNGNNGQEIEHLRAIERDYQKILQNLKGRAAAILRDVRSTSNNFLVALTSWTLYKVLPYFLKGVATHARQIEMLKTASKNAAAVPLIFLPLHRSHLDKIMLSFILHNNGIRIPLQPAGNNLQIPLFGQLLRGLGAFFIERSRGDPVVGSNHDNDIVYKSILNLILQHALKMGHNIDIFIEGGRTRTGKPHMPNGDLLSVIVSAFMDGTIPDALIVPVSVNYEKLVDGNFVREQKGGKKMPESFGRALAGIWKALNSKCGLMCIEFNTPYSLKKLVRSYHEIALQVRTSKWHRSPVLNQPRSSPLEADILKNEHHNLIDSISRQVVYDCTAATSVMSTNALSFLMLTYYRNGAPDFEIAKGLDNLRSTLKGLKHFGFLGDSLHVINYATDLLGKHLVVRTKDKSSGQTIIRPKGTIESWMELAYYANIITPHFALQSIVLTAFHNLLPPKSAEDNQNSADIKLAPGVSRDRVIELALEYCDAYRYEFILNKPSQVLIYTVETTLDELISKGFITTEQTDDHNPKPCMEIERKARAIAAYIEENDFACDSDNGDFVNSQTDEPNIWLAFDDLKQQKPICEILAPLAHTYLCVAKSLCILYKTVMLESEFIKYVLQELHRKVMLQKCPYPESISRDSVRNCLKVLKKWNVIEISKQCGLRLISLATYYDASRHSLKTIMQRMSNLVPGFDNGYI